MTNFRETWYVGSARRKSYPGGNCHQRRILNSSFAYLSVWATVMKLSMWVFLDSSITHVFCCYRWAYFNTQMSYLKVAHLRISSDYLNDIKVKHPDFYIGYSDQLGMWGALDSSITHCSVAVDAHIKCLICILSPKVPHGAYSMNISSV